MKYIADADVVTEYWPIVAPSRPVETKSVALRHARAMAAVLRAAKAEHMARHRANALVGCGDRYTLADQRHTRAWEKYNDAVDRLVAVEKEVERGK